VHLGDACRYVAQRLKRLGSKRARAMHDRRPLVDRASVQKIANELLELSKRAVPMGPRGAPFLAARRVTVTRRARSARDNAVPTLPAPMT
jgi:hypothetical protein